MHLVQQHAATQHSARAASHAPCSRCRRTAACASRTAAQHAGAPPNLDTPNNAGLSIRQIVQLQKGEQGPVLLGSDGDDDVDMCYGSPGRSSKRHRQQQHAAAGCGGGDSDDPDAAWRARLAEECSDDEGGWGGCAAGPAAAAAAEWCACRLCCSTRERRHAPHAAACRLMRRAASQLSISLCARAALPPVAVAVA